MKHGRTHGRTRRSRPIRSVEPLEGRRLLAWSGYAQLIGQDDAAERFADLTGRGQTVAVIDTGIDYTHDQLGDGFGKGRKVVAGYDFLDDDADPMDTDGHGTEVAGLIASDRFTSGGTTYQGLAPGARLVALRVGTGDDITDARIERALRWVIDNRDKHGITVVNISLGSGAYATADTARSQLADEFAELAELNVVVVAASGNDGTSEGDSVSYPAADPNVIAAGSVDAADDISGFTQRGRKLGLLAPGEDVRTTRRGDGHTSVDGTSFSAPIVAGAAALVRQAAPSLGARDVDSVLRASSATLYDGDGDRGITTDRAYGRLDLVDAITLAQSRGARDDLDALAATRSTSVDAVHDASGVLHLAYYDATKRRLLHATRQADGTWSNPARVDPTRDDVGQQLSLAIDPTGKPAVAYYNASDADLKYATFADGAWSAQTVDAKNSVGQFPSLAFDDRGQALIAYYKKSGGDLKLARASRATGAFAKDVIDGSAADVGHHPSVAYNSGGGYDTVAVAYADRTNGDLKYWRTSTDPQLGTETFVVSDRRGVANVELSFLATRNGAAARIAFQDARDGDVLFAYRQDTWATRVVADAGSVGQNVKSYVDADGDYHVVYYDRTRGGTYDARIDASNEVANVARIGTAGLVGAVTADPQGNVELVGLNRVGKSIGAWELIDA